MPERQNSKDRNPGEDQESNLNPDRTQGSDVIGGNAGRASGDSDVVDSSSDLGPDTDTASRESASGSGEVY
jgi:hypothetical protein